MDNRCTKESEKSAPQNQASKGKERVTDMIEEAAGFKKQDQAYQALSSDVVNNSSAASNPYTLPSDLYTDTRDDKEALTLAMELSRISLSSSRGPAHPLARRDYRGDSDVSTSDDEEPAYPSNTQTIEEQKILWESIKNKPGRSKPEGKKAAKELGANGASTDPDAPLSPEDFYEDVKEGYDWDDSGEEDNLGGEKEEQSGEEDGDEDEDEEGGVHLG